MEYTHYFTFKKPAKGQARKAEAKYQRAVLDCARIIKTYYAANGGISGYTAHTKLGEYGGICVNGAREQACEPFELQEYFRENIGFHFVKTAQLPYDAVVVACLIVLKHHLGDLIEVSSDGQKSDWQAGLDLAKRILKKKSLEIPQSIAGDLVQTKSKKISSSSNNYTVSLG